MFSLGIDIHKVNLPINNYELADNGNRDDRFLKVKIWVAHEGENLNNTVFEKEALEKMAPSLGGVPIVGYIEKNEDDETDFSDHRQTIKLQDGDVKIDCECHAYGFIPDTPEYAFEYRDGKEWLVVYGYLWTKFNKAIEVFEEGNGRKSHSMEIDKIDGVVDDLGRLNISNAVFTALCILGNHIPPAMRNSTIEVYSYNSIKKEIREMITEFSKKGEIQDLEFEKKKKDELKDKQKEEELKGKTPELDKDGKPVDKKKEPFPPAKKDPKENEPEAKNGEEPKDKEADPKLKDGKKPEKDLKEDEEKELKDDKKPAEKTDPEKADPEKEKAKKEEEEKKKKEGKKEKKFELVYAIPFEDIREKIYEALSKDADEQIYFHIVETYENEVVVDEETYSDKGHEHKTFKVNFVIKENKAILGDRIEVLPMYLTKDEVEKVEADRDRLIALETELKELKGEKAKADEAKKEKVLETYSQRLSKEQVEKLKKSIGQYTVTDLEKEIAYLVLKSEEEGVSRGLVGAYSLNGQTTGKYGELERLFNK